MADNETLGGRINYPGSPKKVVPKYSDPVESEAEDEPEQKKGLVDSDQSPSDRQAQADALERRKKKAAPEVYSATE